MIFFVNAPILHACQQGVCEGSLKLVKEVHQLQLFLEVIDKKSPNIPDLVYNRDRIFDREIVNV